MHKRLLKNICTFVPNEELEIKKHKTSLFIKPILVDHSAYDSFMFLIKGGALSLLYTGDFRSNGRKSFAAVLKSLPSKVDYLICEATNMFYPHKNMSEITLENKAAEIMSHYKRAFVFQAGSNIDRLVSFYKASRKTHKAFLMDTYVALITQNLPNIPNVKTFDDVYCFWDFPKALNKEDCDKFNGDFNVFHNMRRGLGYCEIGDKKHPVHGDLSNFTMLVRPSMMRYLKLIDKDKKLRYNYSIFDDAVLIYSLYSGYKENKDVKDFLDKMQKLGVKIETLHTSGHADKETIDRLKNQVNPTHIEYVHYFANEDKQ